MLFLSCAVTERSAVNCSLNRVSCVVKCDTRSCSCCRFSVSCCVVLRSTSNAARRLSTTSLSMPSGSSAALFCSTAMDLPHDTCHITADITMQNPNLRVSLPCISNRHCQLVAPMRRTTIRGYDLICHQPLRPMENEYLPEAVSVMSGWEDNCRSVTALVMHQGLCGISNYWLNGLR